MSKQNYGNLLTVLGLAVFVFFVCQALINLYVYPGIMPDEFVAAFNRLTASIIAQDGGTASQIIFANLRTKTIDTFENGEFVRRYKISGAGNPKLSPTPTGDFEILSKYPKVFSNLSRVWMPWSMRFFKQYYFHDVPLYPSGGKVNSKYSLGCIRIGNDEADEIYNWAVLGTKVKIINGKLVKEENSDSVYYLTEKGLKRPMFDEKVFLSYGNRWTEVIEVPAGYLSGYPDNVFIRAEGGHKVYKLEEGKKRWVKNMETFEKLGGKWDEVAPINETELNSWPDGEELSGS